MNLVRKLKISKIVNNLTDIEKEIIDFINSKLDDLIPFQTEDNLTSICYMTPEGKWVLEQDNKTNTLWVRYYGFWHVLETKYLMKHDDIEKLMKYLIEQSFKQKVSIPTCTSFRQNHWIENAFKEKLSTPTTLKIPSHKWVEQEFKKIL